MQTAPRGPKLLLRRSRHVKAGQAPPDKACASSHTPFWPMPLWLRLSRSRFLHASCLSPRCEHIRACFLLACVYDGAVVCACACVYARLCVCAGTCMDTMVMGRDDESGTGQTKALATTSAPLSSSFERKRVSPLSSRSRCRRIISFKTSVGVVSDDRSATLITSSNLFLPTVRGPLSAFSPVPPCPAAISGAV